MPVGVVLTRWSALLPAQRAAVRSLAISPEQLEFAGAIDKSIAATEGAAESEVAGLAIEVDAAVAGWVLLKRGAAAPDWAGPGAAVIGGLRIDLSQQGRGLGAAALGAIADWVRLQWPECTHLTLRVDDVNQAGIRAYEKAGCIEVGERRQGRVGIERTMAAELCRQR